MLFVLRNSNAVIFDVEFYVHFGRVDSAVHDDVYDPSSFGFFLRRGVFNRVVDNIHQALANAKVVADDVFAEQIRWINFKEYIHVPFKASRSLLRDVHGLRKQMFQRERIFGQIQTVLRAFIRFRLSIKFGVVQHLVNQS